MPLYDVVEVCAGAGGQALGLELAGFRHAIAIESDSAASATLRANRPGWKIAEGDVTTGHLGSRCLRGGRPACRGRSLPALQRGRQATGGR